MRLLTHNQVQCIVKRCERPFPLRLAATRVERVESELIPDLVVRLWPRVDYAALLAAAAEAGVRDLPPADRVPKELEAERDAALIRTLHTVLLDTHVVEGALVCAACGREYPIKQGIPNMRLNETEV
jgi:multifunctional methyltransferase subunit TRM112